MAKMIIKFMVLETNKAKSHGTKSNQHGEYQKLLTQIDHVSGYTLLTWAIKHRHPKLVEKLINVGADFRVHNRFGRAAFEEACAFGCMETLSVLLDAWPEVVLEKHRKYLIAGIESAIMANRRMVVAELLSFFRAEFRYLYKSTSTFPSYDKEPKVPPNPVAEEEALRLFLGAKPHRETSAAHLMKQASNTLLLTADESRLLQLNKMVALAQKQSLPKIVEIIHAHAIISDDDTHSDSSSV
jgi:ankyrin repeat protein